MERKLLLQGVRPMQLTLSQLITIIIGIKNSEKNIKNKLIFFGRKRYFRPKNITKRRIKMKKLLSMQEIKKDEKNLESGNISCCLTGSCPTVFDYDDNNYVIQGFICPIEVKNKLELPKNEDVVIIPKELIDKLNKGKK